jgi:hypothetical protein
MAVERVMLRFLPSQQQASRCWADRTFYKRGRSCNDVLSALERRELQVSATFVSTTAYRKRLRCDTDAPLEK